MKVNHFFASGLLPVTTTVLTLTGFCFASPVDHPSLANNVEMTPNSFLDLSTWIPNDSAINLDDPSTWAIDVPTEAEDSPIAGHRCLKKRHDYAMVCAGQREHTAFCQRSPREYYCSQNGYVIQKDTATVKYTPCEDQCVCAGVVPKPVCLVGWKGTSTCLRSLPGGSSVEFLGIKLLDPIAPQNMKRGQEAEVIHVSELATRAAELGNTLEPSVFETLHGIARAEERAM